MAILTNVVNYPVYATKAALIVDLHAELANSKRGRNILARLGNTATNTWADPTAKDLTLDDS